MRVMIHSISKFRHIFLGIAMGQVVLMLIKSESANLIDIRIACSIEIVCFLAYIWLDFIFLKVYTSELIEMIVAKLLNVISENQ